MKYTVNVPFFQTCNLCKTWTELGVYALVLSTFTIVLNTRLVTVQDANQTSETDEFKRDDGATSSRHLQLLTDTLACRISCTSLKING